ncbi:DUF4271 domain-containing protein [Maribacter polysiphoniae]|uniref:DUF4271 domain-containing protein n=1 Tax=Maribacter polysiphoniae TaxID=429344 RepID=A0A316ERX9_9FLAO|nr:DUF4271 domain-containing protein [Maribacter polysiphoniae]MBD1260406.1 DUF4271 domain-containing protein [Maribacter polysiphoniae]PWK25870.1 uncharacterized protein DUF4271 [Maribacter polysiphoniae]
MEAILRNTITNDWITILVVLSLLFLVLAKNVFYSRFLNFIILPFNNKYIFMYNKKEKLMNWFNLFWGLFLIINFSLFIYLALNIIMENDHSSKALAFPWIIGAVIVYIFLKLGLQLGNGYIFGIKKMITEVLFKKLSYFNYSGMIMFLANIILTYILLGSKPVVYVAILLILLVNIIGWITILRNHQKLITSYFFYFILYLCALEIAPLILIGSYLKD